MKAIVQERFGSPDALQLVDVDLPEIGPDDVLVRATSTPPGRPASQLSAPDP